VKSGVNTGVNFGVIFLQVTQCQPTMSTDNIAPCDTAKRVLDTGSTVRLW